MAFVRGACPIWLFVNLTGQILDDTYYAFFLQNTLPYLFAPVYQDPEGNVPWANPLEFQPSGTLPNNLYFDDTMTYRIEIRQGNSQTLSPLIWLIENYVPDQTLNPEDILAVNSENLITNPQFSIVNILNPTAQFTFVVTTAAPIPIAPGWALSVTGGSATIKVNQVALAGSANIPTNPPYALNIESSGTGTVELIQTFEDQGGIWANESVAFSLVAKSINGAPVTLNAQLVESTGTPTALYSINLTSSYVNYPIAVAVPTSTNTDLPPTANTQLQIFFTVGGQVSLTSIQLIGQSNTLTPTTVDYEQIPVERQIDHMFNYYNLPLQYKPIASLLTGWDFPLNPGQVAVPGTITGDYILDQTISASGSGSPTWARDAVTNGLQITASDTNNAFYILQYLSGSQAMKMLGTILSSNINAYATTSDVVMKVYMYSGNSSSTIPVIGSAALGILDISGNFTLTAANWTLIARGTLGQAVVPLTQVVTPAGINGSNVDYGFSGWEITGSQLTGLTNYAIVVTFAYVTPTVITVNSVSVVPGEIPTRPAPQTPDEVLRECEYYYEKSYETGTVPGTNTLVGSKFIIQTTSNTITDTFPTPFEVSYKTYKRPTAATTLWSNPASGSGLSGHVTVKSYNSSAVVQLASVAVSGTWSVNSASSNNVTYAPAIQTSINPYSNTISAGINFHYVVEARLGKN